MSDRQLVMAYADPPYPRQAFKHYRNHPDYAGEVDHGELIDRLLRDYPDGWALSTSTPASFYVQSLCEERGLSFIDGDVRLEAWLKSFAAFKKNVRVAYAWEPIIVKPAIRLPGAEPTRDWIETAHEHDLGAAVKEPITLKRGLTGAKPDRFCGWLFEVMGLRRTDELHDLFPGSHAVSEAWRRWASESPLGAAA